MTRSAVVMLVLLTLIVPASAVVRVQGGPPITMNWMGPQPTGIDEGSLAYSSGLLTATIDGQVVIIKLHALPTAITETVQLPIAARGGQSVIGYDSKGYPCEFRLDDGKPSRLAHKRVKNPVRPTIAPDGSFCCFGGDSEIIYADPYGNSTVIEPFGKTVSIRNIAIGPFGETYAVAGRSNAPSHLYLITKADNRDLGASR